jgi:very-short-patch-repair endonuclease
MPTSATRGGRSPSSTKARQHAEPEQFGRDIERYSLMAADGWLVLRFAGRHLGGPWTVVERTRRALLGRGWR